VRAQLERFGWQLLTQYIVRNADWHTKNIALTYTHLHDVAYSPVYDVVTTQAYPRYATNPPSLPLDGRQTWALGKNLERFFNASLGIAPKYYAQMVECLCESVLEVGHEVIAAAKNEPRWHTVAKQMVYAWNEGMTTLRSRQSRNAFTGLGDAIAQGGFSEAERPESTRTVIGRSQLLG